MRDILFCKLFRAHANLLQERKDNIVMGGEIPGEMVIIYQDAFRHFDTKNCGMVSSKSLGPLLRFVGENPSDAEVQVCFASTIL